jgi:hypothetical protein
MSTQPLDPQDQIEPPREAQSRQDLNMLLHERIARSREIMAELDSLVAASREAVQKAEDFQSERRARNPVRIRKPRR